MSTEQVAFFFALALSSVLVLTTWAYEALRQPRRVSTQHNNASPEGTPITARLKPLVPVVTKSAIAAAIILATLTFFSPQIASFFVSTLDRVQPRQTLASQER